MHFTEMFLFNFTQLSTHFGKKSVFIDYLNIYIEFESTQTESIKREKKIVRKFTILSIYKFVGPYTTSEKIRSI